MKKIFLLLLFLPIIILSGCTNTNNTTENTKNIEISRTGTISNDTSLNILTNESNNDTATKNNPSTLPYETILYEFSTPIKSKSSNRLNNIKITCSKLNGLTIKPQEEFSFCKTIGKATEQKGYKKADVIMNKEIIQALGGGNCQVSSTLYNAVLGIQDLQVTERHPHGKKVNYVPEGKDAAISYGSKDFKFINNLKESIKIYANADNGSVNIKIVSLK